MSQTVIGIFENTDAAQEAKAYLVANGFNNSNVDINASGNTLGDGTSNKIGGFFSHLFEDSNDAQAHTAAGRTGTIVTVHAQSANEAEKAMAALDNFGAVDVNEYAQRTTTGSGYGADTSTGKIEVIEENLQVGKREVETGGMRLRSRIIERPVEESIRLREEHVNIERTPVNRPATEADFTNFKEGTIEVTEHAERAVVAKEARVVEEVSLDKEVTEREETIKDTVRHTEVDAENITSTNKTYTTGSSTDTASDQL